MTVKSMEDATQNFELNFDSLHAYNAFTRSTFYREETRKREKYIEWTDEQNEKKERHKHSEEWMYGGSLFYYCW
jgi:hypothetical protein